MKSKTFDCVEMKHRIQESILKELAGLSPAERRRKTQELIESDLLLARIWRYDSMQEADSNDPTRRLQS